MTKDKLPKKKEEEEQQTNDLKHYEQKFSYLYPTLNNKEFNNIIAKKKEFNDTKYDGTIYTNVQQRADELAKADFELQPHQLFIKNFLSIQTPYSSLLLYHGLGSGKTCSAIGVCEEMRDYMKQTGKINKIFIVASSNVQKNFKLQLFDENKLKFDEGIWKNETCLGKKFLKEIDPMNMFKEDNKQIIITKIDELIKKNYKFLGYIQFANIIESIIKGKIDTENDDEKKQRLQKVFNNKLIVIDEIHNIRKTDDNGKENRKVADLLDKLVDAALNMRLLFLSIIYYQYML